MSATASSYSITMRLHTAPDHGVVGKVATAIAREGGIVTAIDVADSSHDRLVVDVTCSAADADHSERVVETVREIDGVEVHKVSDRTFLLHLGGKIEVTSKVPLRTRDDLRMAYTPGVGRVSMALFEHPEDVSRLTIKGNTVAVVTDGSAVLGLGNIGPGAALPVMEGKAALFKRFANIDAWPICLASQDTDEIVQGGRDDRARLRRHQPRGHRRAALLRDRGAAAGEPRHPGLPRRPARYGDRGDGRAHQRAARGRQEDRRRARRRRRRGRRRLGDRHPDAGRGHHGHRGLGPRGLLSSDDTTLPLGQGEPGRAYQPAQGTRRPARRPQGRRRVRRRQRAPRARPEWIKDMAPDAVVFALANPDPEVDPAEADKYAAVVASGRSDYPNQINNVLAFPGVFRGLLDARAKEITLDMLLRAADAIAQW